MRHPPYEHQRIEFIEHGLDLERMFPWEMRTGKSKATIDSGCALAHIGKVKLVVVSTSTSALDDWELKGVNGHAWESQEHAVYVWRSANWKRKHQTERREDFEWWLSEVCSGTRVGWILFVRDSARGSACFDWIEQMMKKFPTLLALDEIHRLKSPKTKTFKQHRKLSKMAVATRGMSGTLIGNDVEGVWAQFELVSPAALGVKTKTEYCRKYVEYEQKVFGPRRFNHPVGFRNYEDLAARMATWGTFIETDDCDDLPPLVYRNRYFDLQTQEIDAYQALVKEVWEQWVEEVELIGPNTQALRELEKHRGRLMGLRNGFVLEPNTREASWTAEWPSVLAALEEELKELGYPDKQVVLWGGMRALVDRVTEEMNHGHRNKRAACLRGGVNQSLRRKHVEAFRSGKLRALVCHPACASEGLDLSVADRMIWVSLIDNKITYDQANRRCTKMGGKSTLVSHLIARNTVDASILEGYERKKNWRDTVMRGGRQWLLDMLGESPERSWPCPK